MTKTNLQPITESTLSEQTAKALERSVVQKLVERRITWSLLVAVMLIGVLLCVRVPLFSNQYALLALESAGYILLICGLLLRLWSILYIGGRKGKHLQTKGPYSLVRHPLYLGSLLLGLGFALITNNLIVLGIVLLFFLLQYSLTIRAEEAELLQVFGEEYSEYRRRVPCFLPCSLRVEREPPQCLEFKYIRREAFNLLFAIILVQGVRLVNLLYAHDILPLRLW